METLRMTKNQMPNTKTESVRHPPKCGTMVQCTCRRFESTFAPGIIIAILSFFFAREEGEVRTRRGCDDRQRARTHGHNTGVLIVPAGMNGGPLRHMPRS